MYCGCHLFVYSYFLWVCLSFVCLFVVYLFICLSFVCLDSVAPGDREMNIDQGMDTCRPGCAICVGV